MNVQTTKTPDTLECADLLSENNEPNQDNPDNTMKDATLQEVPAEQTEMLIDAINRLKANVAATFAVTDTIGRLGNDADPLLVKALAGHHARQTLPEGLDVTVNPEVVGGMQSYSIDIVDTEDSSA